MKAIHGFPGLRRVLYLLSCFLLSVSSVKGEISKKILFVDEDYFSRYAGDTKTAERYFLAQGFVPMNAGEIADYMKNGTAPGSVILSLTDVSPKIWAEPYDRSSPIYRYCSRGGRFVAPGGSTLMSFIGKDDMRMTVFSASYSPEKSYIFRTFGIKPAYGMRGKDRVLTESGKAWGLDRNWPKWAVYLDLAVPAESVEPFVTAKQGAAALIWLKNINKDYPYSGLLGACFNLRNHLPTLEAIYRVCTFDGVPADKVQKVDYSEKKAARKDFDLKIESGGIPRKVFECGETIPVKVIAKDGKAVFRTETVDRNGTVMKGPDTTFWDEGEYAIRCISDGKTVAETKIFIAAKRRIQPYPIFVWKNSRPQLNRERIAADFLEKRYLNPCIDDIHQMTDTAGDRLGNVIDEALKHHQMFTARTSVIKPYTDNKDDQIVLYNGKVHSHGVNHYALSSRAQAASPEKIAKNQSAQVKRLSGTGAPNFYPFIAVNDDGSMLGNFDFHPKTMADLEKKTGLKRSDLPKFEKQKHGNQVYMPVVEKGIVSRNHPFLRYFRYHTGNYSRIAEETVKASHGIPVGDIGLMAGPLYPGRGFYPPLSHSGYPFNCFYNYTFWYSAISFNLEFAKTAGREKPWGAVVSAHYTPWGGAFQRGILYRLIANSPGFIGLWHLDESKDMNSQEVKSTWAATEEIAANLAGAGEFYQLLKPVPRKAALFYDIAQICFQWDHVNAYPYSRYCALENFRRAGGSADVISSEEVEAGKLGGYDLVILHDCQWMTDKARDLLAEYIKRGGHVIGDDSVTVEIPGIEKISGTFGMGLSHIGADSCVARYLPFIGKYLKPEPVVSTGIDGIVYNSELPDKTVVAWILDCETNGERRECQQAMSKNWNHGAYEYLTELEAKTGLREHKLKIRGNVVAYNLFSSSEIPVKDGIATVKLRLLDAVPVLLLKERIRNISAAVGRKSASRGEIVAVDIALHGAGKIWKGGTVPAQVRVECGGKELWTHGGNVVLREGKGVFRLTVPMNAAPGKWRIAVTELASGKTALTELEIK